MTSDSSAGHSQGAAGGGGGPPQYNGVPIVAGTPNHVKLCDIITCLAAEWNATTAGRANRLKANGQICHETGSLAAANPGHWGSSTGSGNGQQINLPTRALCDKQMGVATLLHEIAHGVYTNLPSPEEHCRVWFIEYKYWRAQQNTHAAGTPEHATAVAWICRIEGWYGNFRARYDNGGGAQADAPPPTPLPAPGNACRVSMESIQPPGGGRTVHYSTSGTGTLCCDSWPSTAPSTITTASFTPAGAQVIADWRLVTTGAGVPAIVGVASTLTGGIVFTITDTDGDLIVDSVSIPIPSASGLVDPVAIESSADQWYVLDHGTSRVWTLDDADGDDLPDALGTVFADATTTPSIADAVSLGQEGPGQVSVKSSIALHQAEISPSDWRVVLTDDDGDGSADTVTVFNGLDGFEWAPVTSAGGREDDQFVLIEGVPGNAVEVRNLDPQTGQFTIVIGSGTLSAAGQVCVQLDHELDNNEAYQLHDVTDGRSSVTLFAPKKGTPQTYYMSPSTGAPDISQVVTIRGYGLPDNPNLVQVRFGADYGTVVSASETELLVATPVFGAGRRVDVDVVVEKQNGQEIAVAPVQYHTLPE